MLVSSWFFEQVHEMPKSSEDERRTSQDTTGKELQGQNGWAASRPPNLPMKMGDSVVFNFVTRAGMAALMELTPAAEIERGIIRSTCRSD